MGLLYSSNEELKKRNKIYSDFTQSPINNIFNFKLNFIIKYIIINI